MMAGIDEYVTVAFCRLPLKQDEITQSFRPRFEIEDVIRNLLVKSLQPYKDAAIYDASALANRLFEIFLDEEVIELVSDPIAGDYYRLKLAMMLTWRKFYLDNSEVGQRAELIGSRFLRDAFFSYFGGKFEEMPDLGLVAKGSGIGVPASDRVVTLSHNQQTDLETASSELIDVVSLENAIDGDVSLTQRVLGQLRAGRELIRAQTLNAYLLYSTVMTVIGGLIQRYRDQAIGVAAKRLLELLVEHIFGK